MTTNILVIGLGSMGKRRIRNLQSLGVKNIIGFDSRPDRCEEAESQYKIPVSSNFETIIDENEFNAWIISVPPDQHHIYMKQALAYKVPAFIEASVVDTDLESIISEAKREDVLLAPSCTLYFHPAIRKIFEIVKEEELGTISNFLYHSGQYLPDWHSYEKVSEYYVSNKATGGAREIVPFELSWITKLLGFPVKVCGFYKKTINIEGASEIDDTYNLLMDYGNSIFNLSVDVVSRYATRRLVINGDKKQLYWNWDENMIRIFNPVENQWENTGYEVIAAHNGYNSNITEQMYIDEMSAFIKAVLKQDTYPNSLEEDHKVLKVLYSLEESANENRIIPMS